MSNEDLKAEHVSRAKLSEQAERYDDMAEFMRLRERLEHEME